MLPLVPAWRLDKSFDYLIPDRLAGLACGSLVRVPFGGRNVRGVVVGVSAGPSDRELAGVRSLVVDEALAPAPLDRLLEWVALRYAAPRGAVYRRVVPPRVRVDSGRPLPLGGGRPPERLGAYEGGADLVAALELGQAGLWALRPLPGEDRAALIAELAAAAGRCGYGAALVTVPEVRYGSMVLEGPAEGWPSDMARIDSARDDSERARAWLMLARGHGLGGGGRSAVLAPVPRLRLIVVDEAHHPTYKEDRSPRYDARRVAVERARLQGAACVLVTPTPSVELGADMLSGAARVVEPPKAALRARRPVIEMVPVPPDRALSRELHERMSGVLRDGRRVGLLAPRRGFARSMWCASCRRSLRCARCEAGMAFDRGPRRVRCPRCGLTAAAPSACPHCAASDFKYVGVGSERLAEQVARSFPRASVARMDPDVLELGGAARPQAADIYVTTWIGTKAVLRPPVGLVGVLDADALIHRTGFRAAETAYQALHEMGEWAGAGVDGGRLVIQTSEPAHHALQALARADYRYFLDRELTARRELSYPPYSELIKVAATGPLADALLESVTVRCAQMGARVLGPLKGRAEGRAGRAEGRGPLGAEAAVELLVKCRDAGEIAAALRDILAGTPAGNRLIVDVDPR